MQSNASQLNQDMSVISACSTDNVRGPEITESVVISSTEPKERLKYTKHLRTQAQALSTLI